jgi:nucleoside-diphosphate-sugar epimerase
VIWLWTIFCQGATCRPYNVGSALAINIADLARCVVEASGVNVPVIIAKPTQSNEKPARYVPNIARAEKELGLTSWIDLTTSIQKTIEWNLKNEQAKSQ